MNNAQVYVIENAERETVNKNALHSKTVFLCSLAVTSKGCVRNGKITGENGNNKGHIKLRRLL